MTESWQIINSLFYLICTIYLFKDFLFLIFYMLFSLILSHFYFTIKCLRSKQKPRYICDFQNRVRHTQIICFGFKNQGPMGPQWLTWVNSYKSLVQHFRLSVAMATNQHEDFLQYFSAWWRTTQKTCLKKFCQNTWNETAINEVLMFSIISLWKLKLP